MLDVSKSQPIVPAGKMVESEAAGFPVKAARAGALKQAEPRRLPVSQDAFHGVLGDVARSITTYSEADPMGVLASLATLFGNAVGDGVVMRETGRPLKANMYTLLVGPSGRGNKGKAIHDARQFIDPAADDAWERRQLYGLASGEGLMLKLADKDPEHCVPCDDPRLLVEVPEFSNVLEKQGREGSILSDTLRNAWDGKPLQNPTKDAAMRASRHHLSILSGITGEELEEYLHRYPNLLSNGFLNRFLMFSVLGVGSKPFGKIPMSIIDPRVIRLRAALTAARDTDLEMQMTDGARVLWGGELYEHHRRPATNGMGKMYERCGPYTLKYAMVFALADGLREVDQQHLVAATAVVDYARSSCEHIFANRVAATGNPAATVEMRLRDAAAGINQAPIQVGTRTVYGLTKSQLLTATRLKAHEIDRVLGDLRGAGAVMMHKVPRRDGKPGKPSEVWEWIGEDTQTSPYVAA